MSADMEKDHRNALAKMIATYYLYLIGLIVVLAAVRLILVDK